MDRDRGGFTIVELLISLLVLGILTTAVFTLATALLRSALIAKRQATAATLATNHMESLKLLSYDSLAVAGGAIPSGNPLPATQTKTVNGEKFTVKTGIVYTDIAYDGCGAYPTQALKQQYCRNYPPPTGAPATDTNPADTKTVTVTVYDKAGLRLANVDTNIAARVAETASSTGAMFASVVDASGNPLAGASVRVTNSTTSPAIDVSDTSDNNGIVIFYGLPPDSAKDYIVAASKTGFSSLTTIASSGSLQPTYPNQNLLTQSSSFVTLTLKPMNASSLAIETTDVNGNALGNAKVYIKGGYKRYTSTSDTSYYFDNMRSGDGRPTTDAAGLVGVANLVPGDYIFCGDAGATSCTVGGTTYYLAAAVPYGGDNPLNPVTVPTYDADNPPPTTYPYNSTNYLQKVRLILTANSGYPRVYSMTPYDTSLGSGTLSNVSFTIKGTNLPCSSNAASCATQVKFLQGSNTFTASCTGAAAGTQLNCTVNLSGAVAGGTRLQITAGGDTLTLPASPLIGGFVVNP